MSKTAKTFKEVEKSLNKLAKSAKAEIPKDLRETWNNAIYGVNGEAIGNAGASLIESVSGNSKAAQRTRSSVENAVKTAQQKLGAPKKSCKSGKLLLVGAVVAAIIAVVVSSTKKSAAH
ncbi:hypothetical protein ACT3UD_06935 [Glutamicibacter sp. 287]|uniref:hypothetical protein n=1 Tax=unclassified Glutamicibacter TaxID=2627139 RepID=UPI000BB7C20E|nr:hypothetical protein [Glutamicibacter sp. BW80]PCC29213.1 hypothetical protein CIK76_07285 [Glutamicibacter sp. BW80]